MISCQQYDYIEIACLYRLPIQLVLAGGEEITGKALNTAIKDGEEWLILSAQIDKHNEMGENDTLELPLRKIRTMQALIENPHFDTIHFNG